MTAKKTLRGKHPLIIEKSDGDFWGRVKIHDNLIVDSASTLDALQKKMKKLVKEFEDVDVDAFDISFDLTSFFEQHSYLSISDIASKAGINAGLMRQYASGVKFPSADRILEIQGAIREIGKELSKVRLHKPKREYA